MSAGTAHAPGTFVSIQHFANEFVQAYITAERRQELTDILDLYAIQIRAVSVCL